MGTGGGIALAPEGDRRGGAHVPAPKPKKNLGPYREFVREHLKNHGGDMAAVARAYREQNGGGPSPQKHAPDPYTYPFDKQQGGGHCGCKPKAKSSHDQFMKATHDYCKGNDVQQYFAGGAYWKAHNYQKGAGIFGDIGNWFKKAARTVQSIPAVRDVEHGLVKVGSKLVRGALEPAVDAVADGAVSLVGMPELAPAIDAGIHKGASYLQDQASNWVNNKIDQSGQGMYLTT